MCFGAKQVPRTGYHAGAPGPTITVNPAVPDVYLTKTDFGYDSLNRVASVAFDIGNRGPVDSGALTLTGTVTPAGFANFSLSDCGITGQNFSCDPGYTIPANQSAIGSGASWEVNLLALGNYTITITLISANESNSADNTITWSCIVLTGLIVNCT